MKKLTLLLGSFLTVSCGAATNTYYVSTPQSTTNQINNMRPATGWSTNSDPSTALGAILTNGFELPIPVWEAAVVSGTQLLPGPTGQPALTEVEGGTGIYTYGYDAGEYSSGAVQFSHSMAQTNANLPELYISPHLHTSLSATVNPDQTNSVWQFDYQWAGINGDYSTVADTIIVTNEYAFTNVGMHEVISFGNITNNAVNNSPSSVIRFTVTRVTYSTDAVPDGTEILIDSLDIHYPVSRIGSSNVWSY